MFVRTMLVIWIAAAPLLFAMAAHAETAVEFRAGATFSDNVRRVPIDEEDQTIGIAGIGIDTSGESTRYEGSLSADLEFREYLDDAFDSETIPSGNASLTFKPAPDLFHWVIEDDFGQLQSDPFNPETPETREQINVFSTGPDLFLAFGRRTTLQLGGRYRNSALEETASDNETLSGTLSLERAINQNRSVSLNVSADRVEYDDLTFNSNFDRQTAYVGFSSRVSRGEVQLSLGVNELHDQGETFSGTLANLSVNRRLSEISTVRVTYDRRFSDAGDLFTRFDDLGTPNQTPEDVIPIGDPFENERFSIAYEYERGNASFSLSAYLSEDEYQTATLFDSKRVGGTVGGALEFGSGWSLAADFGLENRDFETAGREDDYLVGTLTVERRLTRVVSVSLIYEHEDRASSTDGDDYVENRYSLIFSFRPGN